MKYWNKAWKISPNFAMRYCWTDLNLDVVRDIVLWMSEWTNERTNEQIVYIHYIYLFNSRNCILSFHCQRQLETFANNVDAGETAHNELSHLKSALFATKTLNFANCLVGQMKWSKSSVKEFNQTLEKQTMTIKIIRYFWKQCCIKPVWIQGWTTVTIGRTSSSFIFKSRLLHISKWCEWTNGCVCLSCSLQT